MTASLNGLIPELQDLAQQLDQVVHANGLQGRITSTLRTYAEQKRLYDRYLRGEAEFPAAPPGSSAHEYGYAFDYVVSPWDYQGDVGVFWKDNGLVWSPKDAVHFEYPGFKAPSPTDEYGYGQTPWWGELAGPGPWWASFVGIPSYVDILKQAIRLEKKIGVDAAIDWFYRHVGQNPDAPG